MPQKEQDKMVVVIDQQEMSNEFLIKFKELLDSKGIFKIGTGSIMPKLSAALIGKELQGRGVPSFQKEMEE